LRWNDGVAATRRSLRENAFVKMAVGQVSADLRSGPGAVRRRFTEAGSAARCGSIADLRAAAQRTLPRPVFDFIDGAAGDEVTARRNREAFSALELRPRVLRDVSEVSVATSVLGQPIALPIMGAPHGAGLLFHPDAETGIARALHDAGTIYVVSSMASQSIEHLAREAPGPKWIQMYMWRDRGLTRELIERALATGGFNALVLTVDTARVGPRERDRRNGFTLPPRITLRSVASGLTHPRWSARFVRSPEIGLANLAARRNGGPVDLQQYSSAAFDAGTTWSDVAWLRELWPGPIVLKGILTAEDGALAAEVGVDAVVVSNHGGRQLDHAPAAISALPRVLDAVGGELEVLVDGGVRRGGDVVKALALGARACLVGRPLIYGLAAAGQPGAARAIQLLREELELTLVLLGCPSVAGLAPSYVGSVVQVNT
jgi:isopentenyl diphosphate isomerase/L-lactate dehydrogenase-like FMN-dependent dehydrogenase